MRAVRGVCLGAGSLAFALLSAGCPDKDGSPGSDTDAPATTGGVTTSEAPTTGATSGATTGAPETTTATSSTGDASGGGSAGDSQGTVPAMLCQQACEHLFGCGSPYAPTVEQCVAACEDSAFKDAPACVDGAAGWWTCLGAASCDDVATPQVAVCEVAYAEYVIGCGDCISTVEGQGTGVCAAIVECPDVVSVAMVCAGGTCTCQVDESPAYASCDGVDVCAMDADAIRTVAEGCCGVAFPDVSP